MNEKNKTIMELNIFEFHNGKVREDKIKEKVKVDLSYKEEKIKGSEIYGRDYLIKCAKEGRIVDFIEDDVLDKMQEVIRCCVNSSVDDRFIEDLKESHKNGIVKLISRRREIAKKEAKKESKESIGLLGRMIFGGLINTPVDAVGEILEIDNTEEIDKNIEKINEYYTEIKSHGTAIEGQNNKLVDSSDINTIKIEVEKIVGSRICTFDLTNEKDRKNLLDYINSGKISVVKTNNIPIIMSIPNKISRIFKNNKNIAINFMEEFRSIYRNRARRENFPENSIYENELYIKRTINEFFYEDKSNKEYLSNKNYIDNELKKINIARENEVGIQGARDKMAIGIRVVAQENNTKKIESLSDRVESIKIDQIIKIDKLNPEEKNQSLNNFN